MILAHKTLLDNGAIDVDRGQAISFQSNFVATMFLHPPFKGAALHYLDLKGEFPGR
jgi:hypothetical protein